MSAPVALPASSNGVWGSDWPVCTLGGGLTAWLAATRALVAGASEAERELLFSANARALWGL